MVTFGKRPVEWSVEDVSTRKPQCLFKILGGLGFNAGFAVGVDEKQVTDVLG